ncbi:winged helix-turn-helix domain-containing protein [Halovivax cerinus]|uniref:Helix-turn-helix domain-containing protein n=1 Tax=Halovivax cerinus TaxID=1487865 RepID=A0ABD5NR75_9EURY|nr:helix-turn-helix domain-containing protein [Halovivax cerinus]
MPSDPLRENGDYPSDPADLLPANSVLNLDEYIQMYAAVGHRVRFEILYRLVHGGETTPSDLSEELSEDSSTLSDHIDHLLDAGLIQRRMRTEKGEMTVSTFYRETIFGEIVLTEGIEPLLLAEKEFSAMYGSSVDG